MILRFNKGSNSIKFTSDNSVKKPYLELKKNGVVERFPLTRNRPFYSAISFTKDKEKLYLYREENSNIKLDRDILKDELYIELANLEFISRGDFFVRRYYTVTDFDTGNEIPSLTNIDIPNDFTRSLVIKLPYDGNFEIKLVGVGSDYEEVKKIPLYDLHTYKAPIVPNISITKLGDEIIVNPFVITDKDDAYSFTRFYVYLNGSKMATDYYKSTKSLNVNGIRFRVFKEGSYKIVAHTYNNVSPIIVRESNIVTFTGLPERANPTVDRFEITNLGTNITISNFKIDDPDDKVVTAYVEAFVNGVNDNFYGGAIVNKYNPEMKFKVKDNSTVKTVLHIMLKDETEITLESNTLVNVKELLLPSVNPFPFKMTTKEPVGEKGDALTFVIPAFEITDPDNTVTSVHASLESWGYEVYGIPSHILQVGHNESFEIPFEVKDGTYTCTVRISETASLNKSLVYKSDLYYIDTRKRPVILNDYELTVINGNQVVIPSLEISDPAKIFRDVRILLYNEQNEVVNNGYLEYGKGTYNQSTDTYITPSSIVRVDLGKFYISIIVGDESAFWETFYKSNIVETSIYQAEFPDIQMTGVDGVVTVPEFQIVDRGNNIRYIETYFSDYMSKNVEGTGYRYEKTEFVNGVLTVPEKTYEVGGGIYRFTIDINDDSPVWFEYKTYEVNVSGNIPTVSYIELVNNNGILTAEAVYVTNHNNTFRDGSYFLTYNDVKIASTEKKLTSSMFDEDNIITIPAYTYDTTNKIGNYQAIVKIGDTLPDNWNSIYESSVVEVTEYITVEFLYIRKESNKVMTYPFKVNDAQSKIDTIDIYIIDDNGNTITSVLTVPFSERDDEGNFNFDNLIFDYPQDNIRMKLDFHFTDGTPYLTYITNELRYSDSPTLVSPVIVLGDDVVHIPEILIYDSKGTLREVEASLKDGDNNDVTGSYESYDVSNVVDGVLTLPAKDIQLHGSEGWFTYKLDVGDTTPDWVKHWKSNSVFVQPARPTTPPPVLTKTGMTLHIPEIVISDPKDVWREGFVEVYYLGEILDGARTDYPRELRDDATSTITLPARDVTIPGAGYVFIIVTIGDTTPEWWSSVVSNTIDF